MKRGDLITVAAPGDYGKPRPAIIVQSDHIPQTESILVALITSDIADAPLYRLSLIPNDTNGLRAPSQIMIDKMLAVPRAKCGGVIGRIDRESLKVLNQKLILMMGLSDFGS